MAACPTFLCPRDGQVLIAWVTSERPDREHVVRVCRSCADGYLASDHLVTRELTALYANPMYGVYRGEV